MPKKTTSRRVIKKTMQAWTWPEIKLAVQEIYDTYHHRDDWGVKVIYHESMIQHLKEKLKVLPIEIHYKITPKRK